MHGGGSGGDVANQSMNDLTQRRPGNNMLFTCVADVETGGSGIGIEHRVFRLGE